MKIRIRYHDNSGELSAGAARAFRIGTTVLAMSTVALFSALITMRLAIHTGEVETPSLTGMTLEEAANASNDRKLNLTVENRFYSTTVPAGRVLSQSPAAGANVRKGWHMRITESLGPQRATIPDTVGMNERDAGMAIRRASLDPGAMAHIPSPGLSDVVLAQTPPANAEGVDKPEVSLLLTEPYTAQPKAWVMPNLVGLSYSAASAKMRDMELRVYAIVRYPRRLPRLTQASPRHRPSNGPGRLRPVANTNCRCPRHRGRHRQGQDERRSRHFRPHNPHHTNARSKRDSTRGEAALIHKAPGLSF